jgi:hypothetical protein
MAEFGDIRGETERTPVAAKEQQTSKNYFKNKILKEETDKNVSYINNIKKLSTNYYKDAPLWRRMST